MQCKCVVCLQCVAYNVQQCTMYNEQYAYSVQCITYSVHCITYSLQSTTYRIQCTVVYNVKCTVCPLPPAPLLRVFHACIITTSGAEHWGQTRNIPDWAGTTGTSNTPDWGSLKTLIQKKNIYSYRLFQYKGPLLPQIVVL